MTVFPSRKVAAPCRQYLKDGDGERVSEMSVGRQNDALVVAEQVGAGDVMQLSIHPEQQVAVVVCTQTHTHVNWAAVCVRWAWCCCDVLCVRRCAHWTLTTPSTARLRRTRSAWRRTSTSRPGHSCPRYDDAPALLTYTVIHVPLSSLWVPIFKTP